jgi:hypothetical protein
MSTVLEEADESAFWIELLVDAAKTNFQAAQPLLTEANEQRTHCNRSFVH